ncbi:MAG: pyridoxamine 5'-phosphate oxidase [Pseudomonadota bacterium]
MCAEIIDHSTDRTGIFAGSDPFQKVRDWMELAAKSEPNDPHAASVATVDENGFPNVRIVLLKEIEDDAFVFYTNYTSAKGRELLSAGSAAMCLYWKTTGRQVRIRGTVTQEDGPQADAYYASRPLGSRYGAHASRQSQPLTSRDQLIGQLNEAKAQLPDEPPRPEFWGGVRIVPFEIEFWANGEFRLHDRFQWRRDTPDADWNVTRLNP